MWKLVTTLIAILDIVPRTWRAITTWLHTQQIRQHIQRDAELQAKVRAAEVAAWMAKQAVDIEREINEIRQEPTEARLARLRTMYSRDRL